MKLCSFFLKGEGPERARAGLFEGSRVFELDGRKTMAGVLGDWKGGRDIEPSGRGHEMKKVRLAAPVPRPGKIIATIVNTQGMLGGRDVRLDRPRLDMKAPSAVIGPGERIMAPPTGIRPEVELAAIVGKRLTQATERQAEDAIAGYTILNDVTSPLDSKEDAYEAYRRDRATGKIGKTTMRGPLFRSKNHDTFCPMGPWLVTPDTNPDWSKLRMTTKFDGDIVQDGSTGEYLFDAARIASYVSKFLALEPGDVLSCGSVGWTPAALRDLDPTEFVLPVRKGILELEVQGVGTLTNPVVPIG